MVDRTSKHVSGAIEVVTPLPPFATKMLILPAKALVFFFTLGRKIRLFAKTKNHIPLLAGGVLETIVGKNPTVQQIARVTFGAVSVVKCSEDIMRIISAGRRIGRIFQGKSYVFPIKHKSWNETGLYQRLTSAEAYHLKIRRIEIPILIKRFFLLLFEIFKAIALLALHFADACMAFRANTVSEVFVHGRDLFDKLTKPDAPLIKTLKGPVRKVANFMLRGLGLSWTVTALIGLLTLPAKIREKLDIGEAVENCRRNFEFVADKTSAAGALLSNTYADFLSQTRLINHLPKGLVPKRRDDFIFFDKGKGPDDLRYISPSPRFEGDLF